MADTDPQGRDRIDDETLSAWLADDLSEAEADAVERRLADDPALAARLEALHRTVLVVRGIDDADPPAETRERLRRRLADEGVAVRGRARARWSRTLVGAVAAVLVGVIGVSVIPQLLQSDGSASRESATAPAGDAGEDSRTDLSRLSQDEAGLPLAPVVVDGPPLAVEPSRPAAEGQAALPDTEGDSGQDEEAVPGPPPELPRPAAAPVEDRLRDRFLELPEAEALLGVPLERAQELAGRFAEGIATAPAFDNGTPPGTCLGVVTQGEGLVLVPARVESFGLDGRRTLAYVLVGASEGAQVLDRVEVWVVDPETCGTRVFLSS